MFNKVPEEKVFDYILTMFSMLDGRWLACERISSFTSSIAFLFISYIICFIYCTYFCCIIVFCWRCVCSLFVLRPRYKSALLSVFFVHLQTVCMSVSWYENKIKMGGGVFWEKNFWESEKTFALQLSQSKSFFKS